MYISSIRINNYKSYYQSDEIDLSPGFNIIVGQNDAGKTALIEALSLQLENNPHRSIRTLPNRNSIIDNNSKVEISFLFEESEALNLIFQLGQSEFYIPAYINNGDKVQEMVDEFIKSLMTKGRLICNYNPPNFIFSYLQNYGKHSYRPVIQIKVDSINQSLSGNSGLIGGPTEKDGYGYFLAHKLRSMIYTFKAERLNISQSIVSNNPILSPNASNLPGVLNLLLSSNISRFNKLNELLNIIFPHITRITIPPVDSNNVRIKVWTIDPETERDDLAIDLSESGTGISQVLAILYVVVTSNEPRTIIIDEPQSFLHPGAVRKLMSILKHYPQHQYIISTHSPTVISASNPETLILVRKEESESVIELINSNDTEDIGLILTEVGARLSDVFGADNIIWVEGKTEEICFPLIIEKICNIPLLGTQIIGVINTGDFEEKEKGKLVQKIYERLSMGKSLLPPALCFVFDTEGRSEKEREDLERQGKGKVKFLPRKMYENYLLNPMTISHVINTADVSGQTNTSPEIINSWLNENGLSERYLSNDISSIKVGSADWLKSVDGAKILKDIFSQCTENRVEYRKIDQGLMLTRWIIENSPADFIEIAGFLKGIFENNKDM